ncbi:hypothetical protein [Paenibacillus sp. MBLB4367]|uniref:hypothetical protein n=1 Tax=Paenibacillus sp. MBLB4367 TaxID=3384767 RepID=UPI00390813F4
MTDSPLHEQGRNRQGNQRDNGTAKAQDEALKSDNGTAKARDEERKLENGTATAQDEALKPDNGMTAWHGTVPSPSPSRPMTRRHVLAAIGTAGMAIAGGGLLPLLAHGAAVSAASVTDAVYGVPGLLAAADPGWVSVLDHGAAGDGTTDDTAAFQAAAAAGKTVIVPKPAAFYKLTGSVVLTGSIVGIGMPEIRMDSPDGSVAKRMFRIEGYAGSGLTVTGLHLNGSYAGGSVNEQSHLLRIVNSRNVYVHNNTLDAPYGDCVYVGSDYIAPSENVHIRENVLSNPRRCAVAVVSGRGIWICGNAISDPFPYVAAIDLEPNTSSAGTDIVEDVWIEDNGFYSEIYFVNSYNPNAAFKNQRITIAGNKGKSRYFFRCIAASGDTEHVAIRGNEFYGSVSDARMILCSKVTKGLEISGNRDYATGASGWLISNSAAPVIRDNCIDSGRAIAVAFTDCEAVRFVGNQIKAVNSSYGAVRFTGTLPTSRHQIASNQLINIGNVGYWFGAVVSGVLFDGNVTDCQSKCIQLDAAANGSDIRITADNVFAGSGTPIAGASYLLKWASPEMQAKDAFAGWASAAPTAGSWKRGSVLWNVLPSVSAPAGWICVADGTPGTWESFSTIGS